MPVDVRVGGNTVSVNLDSLQQKSGTLYLQDGQIKESKWSLGRSILGIFSESVRTQNENALTAIKTAMSRTYGAVPSTSQGLSSIKGGGIERLRNRAKMEGFIGKMSQEYGRFASKELEMLRGSREFQGSLSISDESLGQLRDSIVGKEARALKQVGAMLREHDLSGSEVLKAMRTIPRFEALFNGDFGLGKDFTVGVHTGQVMDQYEGQKEHYDLDGLQTSMRQRPGFEDFNADRFMKTVVAFHDIGKSLCGGDNARQHEFTLPILRESMEKMGFSEQEVRLAANLVNNDLLGEWQVGKTHDVGTVRSGLRSLAQDSGVSLKDYLTMQKLFYISDSSSYEPIRESFMEAGQGGKLRFSENRTDDVLKSFKTEHGKLGTLVGSTLLNPTALANGIKHPIDLFSADLSGTGHNIYDMSRLLVENKEELQSAIDQLEPEDLRPTAQARLDQALAMAEFSLKMDADHWTPDHTKGVVVARLNIRQSGITDLLPRKIGADNGDKAYFGELSGMDGLRGKGSVTDKFYELVDSKGGSSKLLQSTGQCQVASSWCPTSMAIKGYLIRSRAVSDSHYFQATSDQHGPVTIKPGECYEKFAHAPREFWSDLASHVTDLGGQNEVFKAVDKTKGDVQPGTEGTRMFDTSIQYQLAMQMEMLENFDFPGNDPKGGTLDLYRVEGDGILKMYGIENVGDTGVMKRGASDSASILCPVLGAGGKDATITKVPHHRIVNTFFLGAQHSDDGPFSETSTMLTNMQREVLFISDGLQTKFLGEGEPLARDYMKGTDPINQ